VQLRVSTRHTAVSDQDRSFIAEKIERLSKFLPGMDRAEVHFTEERNPRIPEKLVCEVTLIGHGHTVRAKANAADHLTATDRVVEKLENKLSKLKAKLVAKPHHRDAARAERLRADGAAVGNGSVATLEEPTEYEIVRSKKVEKLTLSPTEAALRMDLVSHDFYFFTNIDTGLPAVIYRRNDGGFGLIDEIDQP
jgi:putative sigma-54 modulation protein